MTPSVFVLFIFFLRRLEEFCVGAGADVWKVVMLGGGEEWVDSCFGVIMMFVGGSWGLAQRGTAVSVCRQV